MAKAKSKVLKEAPRQAPLADLFGAEPIEYEWNPAVPLSEIIPPADAPRPSKKLVARVKKYGRVLRPLILRRIDERYQIASGRRRYLSAYACELETVPAIVVQVSDAMFAMLTMEDNANSEDNELADLEAMKLLRREGYDEEEINRESALDHQEIKRRWRLDHCDKRIKKAMLDGVCTRTIGEAAAKLPPDQQKKLMDQFAKSGAAKLTMKDVLRVKEASIAAEVAALPQILFTGPELTGDESAPAAEDQAWLNDCAPSMWETLQELERSGALDLKSNKHSRRAVDDARIIIDKVRRAEAAVKGV
jgi:ParB/RepB/Spo0J family partition protein